MSVQEIVSSDEMKSYCRDAMLFDLRFHVLVFPSLIQCCRPPLWPQHKSTLLKLEIAKLFGKHAQCLDGEDEFVVGVGDHAVISY
jgi:hypothetical protein